jgi:hypothetical protein
VLQYLLPSAVLASGLAGKAARKRIAARQGLQQGKAATHLAGFDAGISIARGSESIGDSVAAEAEPQDTAAAAATAVAPAAVVVDSTPDNDQRSHTGQANSMAGPSVAGEVRLLIRSSPITATATQRRQQQQQHLTESLSRESVELADAAAAAAVAAAELC